MSSPSGGKRSSNTAGSPNPQGFTMRPKWLFDTKLSPAEREVYTVLLDFDWTIDGQRKGVVWPSVPTIAAKAGLGPTSVRSALRTLERIGVIDIEPRWADDRQSNCLSNNYRINPLSQQQVAAICALTRRQLKSLDEPDSNAEVGLPRNVESPSGTRSTPLPDPNHPPTDSGGEVEEGNKTKEKQMNLDWTGRTYGTHPAACGGGVTTAIPIAKAGQRIGQALEEPGDSPGTRTVPGTGNDPGTTPGLGSGPEDHGGGLGDQGDQVPPALGLRVSKVSYYKLPLPDPDLEQKAVEILNALDKLRVQTLGVKPINTSTRRSQMTPARFMVAFDRYPSDEVLDVVRWAFSGARGTKAWPKKLTKVYELRRLYPQVLEAFRNAQVADMGPEEPTPATSEAAQGHSTPDRPAPWQRERTLQELTDLRARLEAHR